MDASLCCLGGTIVVRDHPGRVEEPVLSGYPVAVLELLGELGPEALHAESRASCAVCPMAAEPGAEPTASRPFTREACCTYHPTLPNFLVGAALARGGRSEELMVRRLGRTDGVYVLGVAGPWAVRKLYQREGDERFGKDPGLRCPYWEHGSCGIHASRGAICRTWHCRHRAGLAGWKVWMELGELLTAIEERLAEHCARVVRRPWPWSRRARWVEFYRACARAVESVDEDVLDQLRPGLVGGQVSLWTAIAERDAPMPERLQVASHSVEPAVDGRWRVAGYSPWDPVEAPAEVVELIRLLRGGGSWRDAAASASQRTGRELSEDLVRALWRARVLVPLGG